MKQGEKMKEQKKAEGEKILPISQMYYVYTKSEYIHLAYFLGKSRRIERARKIATEYNGEIYKVDFSKGKYGKIIAKIKLKKGVKK